MTDPGRPAESTQERVDEAIPLGENEELLWLGRPRWTVVLPAVLVGAALVVAGLLLGTVGDRPVGLVLVPLGAATAAAAVLQNRRTQYLVTERALYRKTGVLSRRVSRADLATVQNSAYAQGITGTLFGYGTVRFEIAGGGDFSFDSIETPGEVRALVDRETGTDALAGEGSDPSSRGRGVPGRLDQWQAVRSELVALRRAVEQRR